MTSAFIRNLNATPKEIPMATLASQFRGRTKPSSLKGVRDQCAHTRTNTALKGRKIAFPKRISSIARIHRGPNTRKAVTKGSSCRAGRVPVDRPDSDNCGTCIDICGDTWHLFFEYTEGEMYLFRPKMTNQSALEAFWDSLPSGSDS